MRKAFWCSLAGGVMLAGGVFTVAHFAARHPESFVGRSLIRAGEVALRAHPIYGLAPLIAAGENAPEKAPAEAPQAGGDENSEIQEAVIPREMQPADVAQGALVIPDGEPVCQHPRAEPACDQVKVVRQATEVECPAGPEAVAPASMPYCKDHEECEATCDDCETLRLPSVEEEGEEQEESAPGATGAVEGVFRQFEQAAKKSEAGEIAPVAPASQTPDCREDCHRHYHYSGCPYTGHGSMHCPATPPSVPPAPAAAPAGGEESSAAAPDFESSALRAIRRFSSRGLQDGEPTHPEVDTMEYRTSDAHLYEFGPGSL